MKKMLAAMLVVVIFVANMGCASAQSLPSALPTLEGELQAAAVAADFIRFETDVNEASVALFELQLEAAVESGAKVVVVQIDSPGGSIGAGLGMIKAIERAPVPVVCVVDTFALSMGFAILESCDVRIMTSRSVLMGHSPAAATRGMETEARNLADVLAALNHALAVHICGKSKVEVADYEKHVAGGREWWITGDEAVRLGFVDFQVASVAEALQLARQH